MSSALTSRALAAGPDGRVVVRCHGPVDIRRRGQYYRRLGGVGWGTVPDRMYPSCTHEVGRDRIVRD